MQPRFTSSPGPSPPLHPASRLLFRSAATRFRLHMGSATCAHSPRKLHSAAHNCEDFQVFCCFCAKFKIRIRLIWRSITIRASEEEREGLRCVLMAPPSPFPSASQHLSCQRLFGTLAFPFESFITSCLRRKTCPRNAKTASAHTRRASLCVPLQRQCPTWLTKPYCLWVH